MYPCETGLPGVLEAVDMGDLRSPAVKKTGCRVEALWAGVKCLSHAACNLAVGAALPGAEAMSHSRRAGFILGNVLASSSSVRLVIMIPDPDPGYGRAGVGKQKRPFRSWEVQELGQIGPRLSLPYDARRLAESSD